MRFQVMSRGVYHQYFPILVNNDYKREALNTKTRSVIGCPFFIEITEAFKLEIMFFLIMQEMLFRLIEGNADYLKGGRVVPIYKVLKGGIVTIAGSAPRRPKENEVDFCIQWDRYISLSSIRI